MKLINKIFSLEFLRFSLVGLINTIIDLSVLNFLMFLFKTQNPFFFFVFKSISFILAVINSYFMNNYITFLKKKIVIKDMLPFIGLSIVGLIVNSIVASVSFYFLVGYKEILSVSLITTISGIIGSVITMIFNYLSYSHFIFKKNE
jgi:putative flippase GtrA